MKVEDVMKRIDVLEFVKQKNWLQDQINVLRPSGEEKPAEGILNLLENLQDAAEEELGIKFEPYESLEETDEVTEYCDECEREVTLRWNTKTDGLKAYCPYCGKKLMLCSFCPGTDPDSHDKCDWNKKTNRCKFNR